MYNQKLHYAIKDIGYIPLGNVDLYISSGKIWAIDTFSPKNCSVAPAERHAKRAQFLVKCINCPYFVGSKCIRTTFQVECIPISFTIMLSKTQFITTNKCCFDIILSDKTPFLIWHCHYLSLFSKSCY